MWRILGILTTLVTAIWLGMPDAPQAQTNQYPNRVITLVVPFAPGGATDIIARVVAQHLGKELGENVIVDNRPAASGTVGTASVAKAPPDGYTLLLGAADSIVITPHLYKKLLFDPLVDFAPIGLVAEAPEFIAISASLPVKDLHEFIALARAKPDSFNYGSPGVGTIPHLAGDRLARMIGVPMVHVPFRGSAAAMKEVATGEIQFSIATKASADPLVEAGRVKLLAVTTPRRLDSMPDLPTASETGLPGFDITNWWGVLAPKGTDPALVARLNAALRKIFDDPANVALLARQGILPVQNNPQEFAERIQRDYRTWKEIVDASGVRLE
jgi:tripartite-type tricarboxylate transporter receptor subunit TctC